LIDLVPDELAKIADRRGIEPETSVDRPGRVRGPGLAGQRAGRHAAGRATGAEPVPLLAENEPRAARGLVETASQFPHRDFLEVDRGAQGCVTPRDAVRLNAILEVP
jgi:hypothetical protein